jgi:hypothetical protein
MKAPPNQGLQRPKPASSAQNLYAPSGSKLPGSIDPHRRASPLKPRSLGSLAIMGPKTRLL